ncbi:copper-containing nitrite reductase [Parapusillimonas granuli]|uniref:Copper-containing nitrite reductase n=1 Tax=Parapusillimonas granuli TaxID=380911 RepID=A0A853G1F4_9BURK|nr:copper-containing nitrite reductase [Parapusillimonas granuli]MBB5217128.1 nitrite reductase (NO-forming) [Parapusillimonas granuli]MEB2401593.1 copper-containing nitrite reductase [Alcaligenaceae bacterium]NYT50109.1 nitrite reductase, copper-containing [Parapusillimonas granuli]
MSVFLNHTLRTLCLLLSAAVLYVAGGAAWAASALPSNTSVTYTPDVTFTLRTNIADGKLVFVGDAGTIRGKVNPDLQVPENAVVQINLINGDGAIHDIAVPEFSAKSDHLTGKGASTAIVFRANKNGVFEYLCTLPGHKAAGMFGKLIVGEPVQQAESQGLDIAQDPRAVGEPVGKREPRHITFNLETTEVVGQLTEGSTYKYWTFNNKVPGPLLRIRVGDTVTVNVTNAKDSSHIHSVDFHAVTGPGGGAAVTQVPPGQTKSFTFKALHPGLFVYHCATPMVAQHITNGMYGMALVEPEEGLPKVDREYYVMQGELYTAQKHGSLGLQEFSLEKLLDENPEHLMFNGAMNALSDKYKLTAEVGETVRILFGVGGPNLTSSFHVIGEVFDRVYNQGSLTSPPLTDVQTTTVAPGGATMVEFKVDVPGNYILVDHALSRVEKGLSGVLSVTGKEDHSIFHSTEPIDPKSGH